MRKKNCPDSKTKLEYGRNRGKIPNYIQFTVKIIAMKNAINYSVSNKNEIHD